jgi:uncharacterized membrane protein
MLQRLCGPFFVFAGVMHFVKPRFYEAIMPPWLPRHRELVLVSGVAEVAGGAALMTPLKRPGGWWLLATLAAVFPANLHMALHPEDYRVPGGRAALYARLPFQLVFAAWVRAAMRATNE